MVLCLWFIPSRTDVLLTDEEASTNEPLVGTPRALPFDYMQGALCLEMLVGGARDRTCVALAVGGPYSQPLSPKCTSHFCHQHPHSARLCPHKWISDQLGSGAARGWRKNPLKVHGESSLFCIITPIFICFKYQLLCRLNTYSDAF